MVPLHSILTRIVYNIHKNYLVTQLLVKRVISARILAVGNRKKTKRNKHFKGSRMGWWRVQTYQEPQFPSIFPSLSFSAFSFWANNTCDQGCLPWFQRCHVWTNTVQWKKITLCSLAKGYFLILSLITGKGTRPLPWIIFTQVACMRVYTGSKVRLPEWKSK